MHKYLKIHYALAYSALICISPVFTYGQFGFFYISALIYLCFTIVVVKVKLKKINLIPIVLICSSLVISLLLNIENNVTLGNFFILSVPFSIIFMLVSSDVKLAAVKSFVNLYSAVLFVSILCSVTLMLGLKNLLPSWMINTHHGEFILYGLTVVKTTLSWDIGGGLFHRFHGIFMEPGFVGTISAFIVIGNNFNLKKKAVLVSFIGGLISTSFAFYILIALFLLSRFPVKGLLVLFMLSSGLIYIDHPFTNQLIVNRLLDGGEKLDNRNSSYENEQINIFNNVLEKGDVTTLFFSTGDVVPNSTGSYRYMILSYGLVALVMMLTAYYLLLFSSLKNNLTNSEKYTFVICNLLFIASLYQRPYLDNFYMLILFYIVNYQSLEKGRSR